MIHDFSIRLIQYNPLFIRRNLLIKLAIFINIKMTTYKAIKRVRVNSIGIVYSLINKYIRFMH